MSDKDVVLKVRESKISDKEQINTHFQAHYVPWRAARMRIMIDRYGDDFFKGKTILELGAGVGDWGGLCMEKGAKRVLCAEGRERHIEQGRKKYPQLDWVHIDLTENWPEGHFDIVFHMGLFNHLWNAEESIRLAGHSGDLVVFETVVMWRIEETINYLYPEVDGYDSSIHLKGNRATPLWIERTLEREGMVFERLQCEDEYDSPGRLYAGQMPGEDDTLRLRSHTGNLRMMWFYSIKEEAE